MLDARLDDTTVTGESTALLQGWLTCCEDYPIHYPTCWQTHPTSRVCLQRLAARSARYRISVKSLDCKGLPLYHAAFRQSFRKAVVVSSNLTIGSRLTSIRRML